MAKTEDCYCAFCKNKRKIYIKKHVSFVNIFAAILISFSATLFFWERPDPRGLIFLVFFIMISEVVLQLRWRMNMTCPYCGFDPILYLKDPKKVALKVKAVLEKTKNDPQKIFSEKNPLRKLTPLRKPPKRSQHSQLSKQA